MFNYNDIEDELDDRRPVFEGGLYGPDNQKPQPPTILKEQKALAISDQRVAKKSFSGSRRKYYTQGTQLSLFDFAQQH